MIEHVRNFMELYFPGIKGYWSKPYISSYREIESKRTGELAIIFSIHHITDVFNDEWEIKADTFFLLRNSNFYLLKNIITNYEEEVKFDKDDYGFSFEPNGLSICYGMKSASGINSHPGKIVNIPESEWKPVEMLLEVLSIPNGSIPEKMKRLFVGEKFYLKINPMHKNNAYRKNNCILISSKDVAETFKKSGKEEASVFFSNLSDYVTFNSECYKLL